MMVGEEEKTTRRLWLAQTHREWIFLFALLSDGLPVSLSQCTGASVALVGGWIDTTMGGKGFAQSRLVAPV